MSGKAQYVMANMKFTVYLPFSSGCLWHKIPSEAIFVQFLGWTFYAPASLDQGSYSFCHVCLFAQKNQSVENAGVALVKGADERSKFFEKINNR